MIQIKNNRGCIFTFGETNIYFSVITEITEEAYRTCQEFADFNTLVKDGTFEIISGGENLSDDLGTETDPKDMKIADLKAYAISLGLKVDGLNKAEILDLLKD